MTNALHVPDAGVDPGLDVEALAADLRRGVRGEVRFDRGSRALYAVASSNYRQVPIGVVVPLDTDDVVATIAACHRHQAPLFSRGGGTSLAGQCCNVAVVIDTSKYVHGILELDADRHRARVLPGTVLDRLREAAEEHHLTFAPDPSTHNHCTLGGMIGNNSCGVHSMMGGTTVDNVEELEILTYDGLRLRVGATSEAELEEIIAAGGRRGEIYAGLRSIRDRYADLIRERYPDIPRRVSGYNLDQLLPENGFHVARALVGTESTCVTVLEATLRLVPSPPARSLVVLGYPDVYLAADHVPELFAYQPIGLEGLDDVLVANMKKLGLHPEDVALLPDGGGWLMVEFGGDNPEAADAAARRLLDDASNGGLGGPSVKLFDDPAEEALLWKVRESGLGATAHVPGEPITWEGWEDSAVHPDKLGAYLRDLRQLYQRHGYRGAFYGHFGQGCIHTRIDFDLETHAGIGNFRSFLEDAADLVVSHGGSLSGEHGDGQSRAELLPRMFGPELITAFGEFKAVWDPAGKMNPGKVVNPRRLDEDLRIGTTYRPTQTPTAFGFPDDQGAISRAVLRCVGVGECRKESGGTMCPSYMVTKEEQHSTRGRARLLFEMLKGEVITDGWRSTEVRDSLDLCLACKGCKSDCPTSVDMATYKAEFLSQHYRRRLRPVTAYSIGLIPWWARLASRAPRLVNAAGRAPVIGSLAKRLAGIAPQRRLPSIAEQSFSAWFAQRPAPAAPPGDAERVVLWPDTFNNHLHPETLKAAVTVLEAAGARVSVPSRSLCCGRPLYDFGMLSLAKRQLHQLLESLRPDIAAGVPVVVLEPSCLSVLRDEMVGLLPNDEDAKRLSGQALSLAEFLGRRGYCPPPLTGRAVVHGHCHHKALWGMDAETSLLEDLGLDLDVLDSGCCGMAGAFGFEKDHYEVSIKVGERVLLPAVRAAPADTLIIAEGFSCREQIAQTTERVAMHPAEVLSMALERAQPTGQPKGGGSS
ncbi:MAG: FAD-binding and (Fe-S)-binding domain-containing protein [Acidimicrobiales bacterium]